MTQQFEFHFTMNIGIPFKKKEIDEMIVIMDQYVKTKGNYSIELKKYSYEDHRSADGGLFLFLVLGGVADIVALFMSIRELLRNKPKYKEINIKSNNREITITGDISDEAIVEIVKEGKKY